MITRYPLTKQSSIKKINHLFDTYRTFFEQAYTLHLKLGVKDGKNYKKMQQFINTVVGLPLRKKFYTETVIRMIDLVGNIHGDGNYIPETAVCMIRVPNKYFKKLNNHLFHCKYGYISTEKKVKLSKDCRIYLVRSFTNELELNIYT